MDSITAQLQEYGYAVIPDMVRLDEIGKIERFIDDGVSGGVGTRRLIGRPWCSRLADQLTRDMRLSEALPTDARAVQCTLFVKSIASSSSTSPR